MRVSCRGTKAAAPAAAAAQWLLGTWVDARTYDEQTKPLQLTRNFAKVIWNMVTAALLTSV